MRAPLCVLVAFLLAGSSALAQAPPDFPTGAEAREFGLMGQVGPQTQAWIAREAGRQMTLPEPSERRATASARASFRVADEDIEALVFLILMEAARTAQEDVDSILYGLDRIDRARSAQLEAEAAARGVAALTGQGPDWSSSIGEYRWPPLRQIAVPARPLSPVEFDGQLEAMRSNPDALNQLRETETLRLHRADERLSQFMQTLSRLLEKMNDDGAGR